jgi:hypothetical protein
MKPAKHKLSLSTETVRNLGADQLGRIAGGAVGRIIIIDTQQVSCARACNASDLHVCASQPGH